MIVDAFSPTMEKAVPEDIDDEATDIENELGNIKSGDVETYVMPATGVYRIDSRYGLAHQIRCGASTRIMLLYNDESPERIPS